MNQKARLFSWSNNKHEQKTQGIVDIAYLLFAILSFGVALNPIAIVGNLFSLAHCLSTLHRFYFYTEYDEQNHR